LPATLARWEGAAYRDGMKGPRVGTTRYHLSTSWGICLLDRSDLGLARFYLPDPAAEPLAEGEDSGVGLTGDVAGWADLVLAYFNGGPVDFSMIPLDTSGLTLSEQAIYAALRLVAYGETTTYGELAVRIGQPGAARAIGMAMARNPWPLVVPCHRVLAKGGALHGFSAPGGLDTKRRMLVMEGVDLDRGEPMLPGLF
jgi:methylated-DNA-[protein]-cysteine S-methyltransferase